VTQTPVAACALPSVDASQVVVPAPFTPGDGDGDGYWAGGPSAVYDDGVYYLAYRLRRPVGAGRGYANVVARSDDGVVFEPVVTLPAAAYDCDSLERPALIRRPDGGWRIYLSLATRGTLHWRVDAVDADDPAGLATGSRRTVWAGDDRTAAKDPVVLHADGTWHAWVCLHPLPDAGEADRMTTRYATSTDGLDWTWQGDALLPRPGLWDGRGARLTSVVPGPSGVGDPADLAFYDGRASAAQNWYEMTGLAAGRSSGAFAPVGAEPWARSPYGEHTLRYVSAVPLPDGGLRVYFEAAAESGGNDLRTQLLDVDALRRLTHPRG
jgi:hypothetical protein